MLYTIHARRRQFRWLPWPYKEHVLTKDTDWAEAYDVAQSLADLGASVQIHEGTCEDYEAERENDGDLP